MSTSPTVTGQPLAARVVVTNRVSSVAGVVASGDVAAANAHVVLFADEPSRWTYLSRYVQAVRADASGRFVVPRLPPDDRYLAVAVDYLEEEEQFDPEFLDRMRSRARRFALADGERAAFTLPLIER